MKCESIFSKYDLLARSQDRRHLSTAGMAELAFSTHLLGSEKNEEESPGCSTFSTTAVFRTLPAHGFPQRTPKKEENMLKSEMD